jgi:hypothetical protein
MEMGFLVSIDRHLMAGCGLQARALRDCLHKQHRESDADWQGIIHSSMWSPGGHLLVDAGLNTILLADAYNVPVPTKETAEAGDDPNRDDG